MQYAQKYRRIHRGMHSPDERVYRATDQRSCAICGTLTDWTDPVLLAHVCSEECDRMLAMRRYATPRPAPPATRR